MPLLNGDISFKITKGDRKGEMRMESRRTIESIPLMKICQGKQKYMLNEQGIERYLLSKKVPKDLEIAVVSVTGKMRKGKSYILNLILDQVMKTCERVEQDSFYPRSEELVKGFQVGDVGGEEAHGIFVWPEIFLRKTKTGKMIGILLVDTQGTMSSHTPMSEWADIFTISTLFSSMQIYNVSVTLGEQQLQNLELFSEYARHVAHTSSAGGTPFNHLLVLVRDFKYGEEFGYGIEGGAQFFETIMRRRKRTMFVFHTDALPEEHREVRENVLHCFEKTTCCCLPHPGFEGKKSSQAQSAPLQGMDVRFKNEVTAFVNYLLSPENLTVKKIHNKVVTLDQLYYNLKTWVAILNSPNLPTLITSYKSTAQRQYLSAVERAFEVYESKMETAIAGENHLATNLLTNAHDSALRQAVDQFYNLAKFGENDIAVDPYKSKLEVMIAQRFEELVDNNNSRNALLQLKGKAFFVLLYLMCLILQWLIRHGVCQRLKDYEIWVTIAIGGITVVLILPVANVALLTLWNWWQNSSFD